MVTAASVLEEVCKKQGTTYLTKIIDLASRPQDGPNFEATLSVPDFDGKSFEATGTATTKKIAKQNAAFNLLSKMLQPSDLLKYGLITPHPSQTIPDSTSATTGTTTTTFTRETSTGNVYEQLHELCIKKLLPNPKFMELEAVGPSHEPSFSCECRIEKEKDKEDLVVVAKAGQKRAAKRLAATEMMTKIRREVFLVSSPMAAAVLEEDQQPNQQEEFHDFPACIPISISECDNKRKCNVLLSHDHHKFYSMQGAAIRRLHENELNFEDGTDFVEMLKKVAEQEGLQVNYAIFPEVDLKGNVQSVIKMSFENERDIKQRPNVVFGSGRTDKESKNNAAYEGLQFLKQVTRVKFAHS